MPLRGDFLTREQLFAELSDAAIAPGDLVFIERRGEDYAWERIGIGTEMPMLGANTESRPDVWIYYSGQWPFGSDSLERCRLFFADLLDEMEAMAGDMDRCRWLGKCTSSGCIGTPNACLGSLIALVGFELVYPRRHHFRLARTPLHSVIRQTWPMSAVG